MAFFSGRINKLALRHYMEYFDFRALRLDHAFRYEARRFVAETG